VTDSLSHLPVTPLAQVPRHALGDPVIIPPEVSESGHEQHEKICKACSAVRITVLASDGRVWRAWRMACGDWVAFEPRCTLIGGRP